MYGSNEITSKVRLNMVTYLAVQYKTHCDHLISA